MQPVITPTTWNSIARSIHADNVAKGFYPEGGKARNIGELIALMHSELCEASYAAMQDEKDDKLPQYDGFEVEIADTLIRVLDFAGAHEIDIDQLITVAALEGATLDRYSGLAEDMTMLHFALSAILEAHRKNVQLPMSSIPQFHLETVAVVLLLVDAGAKYQINLMEVAEAKLEFNRKRPHKHGKAY
jgi:NTP pyrophosphatase (non-canonical NTP hydrolase)